MNKNFAKFNKFMADVELTIDPEQDLKKIEAKIIQQIPQQTLPNQFYYVINNSTRECIYISDSITDLTGYTPDEWTYKLILDIIHPDDQPFIDKALTICFKLCMSDVINLPVKDALIVNYRIRHKNGHYIHILRNGYCSHMDANNKMTHNTSMCMIIDDFKNDNKQSMFIKEGNKILYELHSDNQESINWNGLSKREREIVELLCKNKTSKQVGQLLFISKHTVDTHRRKILKKLNIKNTTELLFKYIKDNL
jgi:DNA-binding CsgD family transcriptional regulator